MDETKLNKAFEKNLKHLKKKKRKEVEEVERLRIENEPTELEKEEATNVLRRELRELGSMFVEKATELGIEPNEVLHTRSGKEEYWYKKLNIFDGYEGVELRIRRDGNIFATVYLISNPYNEYYSSNQEQYSTGEPNEGGRIRLGDGYKCWHNQFSADTHELAQQTISRYTTAAVDALGELLLESEDAK